MTARALLAAIVLVAAAAGDSGAGEAGQRCTSGADCGPGLFCHSRRHHVCPGPGHDGVCARTPPFCPQVCEALCGCDGKTYCNDCLAHRAGTAVAHAGACDAATGSCATDGDCTQGKFCESPAGACGQPGVCRERPQGCFDLFAPVCGCDHKTYGNTCEAERVGVSVADNSACPSVAKCTVASDCHNPLPHICRVCPDGTTGCAHYVCTAGQCLTQTCP